MFLTPAERIADFEARGWWSGENVDALLRRAVAAGGDAETLIDPVNRRDLDGQDPERLSWRGVDTRVDALAAALLGHGLRKDDIVVAQLPNTVDAVLLFLACARLGLILFAVYLAAYAAYMLVNAFAPKWMDAVVGGVNVAVVSGLGLIGGAVLLALIYAFACRVPASGGRS